MVRLRRLDRARRLDRLTSSNRRPLLGSLLGSLGLVLAAGFSPGCATTGTSGSAWSPSRTAPTSSAPSPRTSSWRYQPLSWEKLEAIESWLIGSGRHADASRRVEAELTLARGRLTFAKRDRAKLTSAVLDARLDAAASGFERVLSMRGTTAVDRQRAREGQREVAALRSSRPRGLVVLPRSAWHAAPARPNRLTTGTGSFNRVTVHHSAEYAGLLRGSSSSESERAIQNIQNYHVGQRNYGDIGYHFLIDPAGRVYEGRSLRWQGAHAGGSNNARNIGVCLLGDFERESPTSPALASLEYLVSELRARYGISGDRVVGHGELKTTACPGRHLRSWPDRYRRMSRRHAPVAAR